MGSKAQSIGRIRSELKKAGGDQFYLGTFDSLASLKEKYKERDGKPNKKKKDDLLEGGKVCDENSWAIVDPNTGSANIVQYKYSKSGKWQIMTSGSGGVTDHEALSGIQGDGTTEHIHLTQKQVDFVNAYKGYFKTEADLLLAFPVDSPDLKGGEYAFCDSPDYGIYLFEFTPAPRKLWIRDASLNYISEKEMKDGIMVKSYGTLNPLVGDLRLKKNGHKMNFESWSGTEWQLITMIGSITTDTFNLLSNTDNSIVGINDITKDAKYHNIYRRDIYTDEKSPTHMGGEFGSFDRGMTLSVNYEDGLEIAYPKDKVIVTVQNIYNVSKGVGTHTFTFKPSSDIEFEKAEFWTAKTTRARMVIKDKLSDEIVYNSQSKLDSRDTNGTEILDDVTKQTIGNIFATFPSVGFLYGDREYIVSMEIIEGEMLGNSEFIYFKIHGYDWYEETVATREWVQANPIVSPQTLQQTLIAGNTMNVNTNINLIGLNAHTPFDISKTTHAFHNTGDITFDSNGYLFSSLNLITVTAPEATSLEINLNPTTPTIAPRLITYQITDVPNKPIDYQQNISFRVTEIDGKTTTVPYKYVVDTKSTPMNGIFLIELDAREIKNIAMVITKFSRGTTPSFPNYGYMKIIKMYDGEYTKLFDIVDGRTIINPNLIVGSQPQLVTWDSILNKPEILPEVADSKKYVRTKGVWVESVGTDVTWDSIKDKPTDILTETLLTTNQHSGLPTTSNGKGLYSKQAVDAQYEVNIAKYDSDLGEVKIGDMNSATVIDSNNLISRQRTINEYIVYQDVSTDALPLLTYSTPVKITSRMITIDSVTFNVNQDCKIFLDINGVRQGEKNCSVGVNSIVIPPINQDIYDSGMTVNIDISTNVAGSIVGILLPTPLPYLGYSCTYIKEGALINQSTPTRRIELDPKGSIVIASRSGQESQIVSFQKSDLRLGDYNLRTRLYSAQPITVSNITDLQYMTTTEETTSIEGMEFNLQVPNLNEGWFVESVVMDIRNRTKVSCTIDGNPVGDGKLTRPIGQVILKPSRPFSVGKTMSVYLSASDDNSFIGAYDKDKNIKTPKITINLAKISDSVIVDKITARTIDRLTSDDNITVLNPIGGDRILNNFYATNFTLPPWVTQPPVVKVDNPMYPEYGTILFNGDYKMKLDSDIFKMQISQFKMIHDLCRVHIRMDVGRQNWAVNEILGNKETFSVSSVYGNVLNPTYSVDINIDYIVYHAYVDLKVDDVLEFSFGQYNNLTNAVMSIEITESADGGTGYSSTALYDPSGKVQSRALNSNVITYETLERGYSRNINLQAGDNFTVWHEEVVDKTYFPNIYKTDTGFISWQIVGASINDLTRGDFDNIKVINYKLANITGTDSIKLTINRVGGVSTQYNEPFKLTYYIFGTDTQLSCNVNTITITNGGDEPCAKNITAVQDGNNITVTAIVDKPTDPIYVKFGDGNNFTNARSRFEFAFSQHDTFDVPLFVDTKLNPEIYDGWHNKLDLTKENIDISIPDNSVYANADMSIAGTRSKGITPITEMKTVNGLTFVDYGSNCILDEDGKWVDVNLTIPASYVGVLCDVEYKIDYKDTIPTISLDDFTIYSKPEIKKTLKDESSSKIVTFKDVPLEDVIRLRTLTTNATGVIKTNLSNCTTSSVKFIKTGATKVVPMFVNNKINEIISTGWDMKVDLPTENIIINKSAPVEYKLFHTIPFARRDEWTPNEWTIFETQTPRESLNKCTHFTIKGENPPPNFTDISVKYQLVVEDENGVRVITDCVACTGMKENIYNKLKSPIPAKCQITLLVNSLQDPFGFLPSDNYIIDFYVASSGTASVPLFSDGLLNKDMMPKTNRVNSIELYSIPNTTDSNKVIEPIISYDSKQYGKIPVLSISTDKAVVANISSYMAETNFYGMDRKALVYDYANSTSYIELANAENPTPINGETWKTAFTCVNGVENTIFAVETYVMGDIILNIKIRRTDSQDFIVDKNFEVSGGIDKPDGVYLAITQINSNKVNIASGEHEIIITKLSSDGILYGDAFPVSRLMIGSINRTSLTPLDTILSQVKYQTTNEYFIVGQGADSGIITGFNHSIDHSLQCDIITIPSRDFNNAYITGIAPNVFPSDLFYMRTIVIEANFTNVHPSNFRDAENKQICKLICSPNNPSYLYLRSLGYVVDSDGTVPNTTSSNKILTTDSAGTIVWANASNNVGDVYLSDKMRIRAVGLSFVFESNPTGSAWVEVGKMN